MRFVKFCLADAPVLAKAAAEIAAGGAKAQDASAGQKMVQRFFFNGIDSETGRCAVAERIKFTADVLTNVTEAGLAIAQTAETRTQRAENLSIAFCLPPQGLFHRQTIVLFTMP